MNTIVLMHVNFLQMADLNNKRGAEEETGGAEKIIKLEEEDLCEYKKAFYAPSTVSPALNLETGISSKELDNVAVNEALFCDFSELEKSIEYNILKDVLVESRDGKMFSRYNDCALDKDVLEHCDKTKNISIFLGIKESSMELYYLSKRMLSISRQEGWSNDNILYTIGDNGIKKTEERLRNLHKFLIAGVIKTRNVSYKDGSGASKNFNTTYLDGEYLNQYTQISIKGERAMVLGTEMTEMAIADIVQKFRNEAIYALLDNIKIRVKGNTSYMHGRLVSVIKK